MQAAAGNLKKVSLELGGKIAAGLILGTPTSTSRSPAPPTAIFFNHGQCCNAGSRL